MSSFFTVIAAKAMAADVQIESAGQQMPAQQMPMQQPPMQEMEFGGMVNGPSHDDGGVRVKMKNACIIGISTHIVGRPS